MQDTTYTSSGEILTAHNLVVSYENRVRAITGVDLTLRAGESVAIVGASGSGKTTLLQTLAGIIVPSRGCVFLHGVDGSAGYPQSHGTVAVSELDENLRSRLRREKFGFVFQQGLLLPELTALENIALPLLVEGHPRRVAEDQARAWLGALGLAGLENRRLGELSGGQAQRVAIARSQITDALITFADEPTGALDSHTSAEMMDVLLSTTVGRGRALVVVTHDASIASRCARTISLADGRIISDGPTHAPVAVAAPVAAPQFFGSGWEESIAEERRG